MTRRLVNLHVAFILLLSGAVYAAQQSCPAFWTQQGSSCYWYSQEVYKTWDNAQKFCTQMGGNLASTTGLLNLNAVEGLAANSPYAAWSGLYKAGSEWKFIDRQSTALLPAQWMKGEPNPEAGNCAAIRTTKKGGGYFSLNCGDVQPFFCSQKVASCDSQNFTTSTGSLSSPNYPDNYANNENCAQYIVTKTGSFIVFSFDYWHVQKDYDTVLIYDGYYPGPNSYLIANITSDPTASGSPFKNDFRTTSNIMTVLFVSDSIINYKGWHGNYSVHYDAPPIYQSGSSGTLLSPNFPSFYPNNLEQYYYVQTADQSQINIQFNAFDTEYIKDYVVLYDGPNTNSTVLGTFSGHVHLSLPALPGPFTTTGNAFTMLFVTDNVLTFQGFNVTWSVV